MLPGVALTLTQPSTGLTRTTVSGRDGRFVLAVLPAGAYELRAELSGFRPSLQPVQISVGSEGLWKRLCAAVPGGSWTWGRVPEFSQWRPLGC